MSRRVQRKLHNSLLKGNITRTSLAITLSMTLTNGRPITLIMNGSEELPGLSLKIKVV
jgi:hypothetical protein